MTIANFTDAELRRLDKSGAMQTAAAVARKIRRATRDLSTNDVLALAVHLHPEVEPADALARLDCAVDDFIQTFSDASRQFRDALAADRERMAPIVAKAARRSLQIVADLSSIDLNVTMTAQRDAAKRQRLKSAGLSDMELEAVAAATDTGEMLARRAALVMEGAALARFLSTREDSDLPAGVTDAVAA